MTKQTFLSTFVALLSLVVLPAAAQDEQPDDDAKYATQLLPKGTVAPEFKMNTLEGKTFKLSQLKGKWVVLDFWASWCPDCRKDAPNVSRMALEFGPRGVQFVGVSMDTDREKWAAAVEKYQMDYLHVSELIKFKETKIAAAYGVNWIPSMYLINPEGKVELATVLSDKLEKTLYERFPDTTPVPGTKENLTLEGAKGKLDAVLQLPEMGQDAKAPLVIQMHGFTGKKEGQLFEMMAASLARHGIATLRFDFNGHGKSEGAFQEMTVPNENEDAEKVYDYVRSLPWVSDIAFVGHSQGGVVAAMTAGKLGADKVKAVVLMAPAAVLRDDAIRGNTMGKTYNPLDPPEYVELWGGQKLGGDYIRTAFRLPIYETAAGYNGKAMIIHGTADRVVPYTYGLRFHQLWAGSEYVELDDFDHGFSQNIYKAVGAATDFFVRQLGK